MGSSARVLNLPVGVTRGCHVPVTRVTLIGDRGYVPVTRVNRCP